MELPLPRALLGAALLAAAAARPLPAAEGAAPFVDSKAIRERFATITAADMEMLRGKKILLASRSFGLNLWGGLSRLAKKDPKYDLVSSYARYDVFKAGGDLSVIPADAFEKARFVHFLATYWPHTKRIEEVERVLRDPPHRFADKADAVIIFFHTALPAVFDTYSAKMDALQAEFPKVRFIYVTAGFMGAAKDKDNENAHAFSEKVRARYKGIAPVYDMGAILSDDFRAGHAYCPEYSEDPANVHPSSPAGVEALAKGFLLVLRDAFAMPAPAAPPPRANPAPAPSRPAAASLAPDAPDAKAVRAILDANGLREKKAEGVSVVENGRVVELYLQEGGVADLPDAVGELSELRRLHLYGDPKLPHPLLRKVSPALARCARLEELLLNDNDLAALPAELARLKGLKTLSVAGNRLRDLDPALADWVRRLDPEGLSRQRAP
jgi:hypothetical protein